MNWIIDNLEYSQVIREIMYDNKKSGGWIHLAVGGKTPKYNRILAKVVGKPDGKYEKWNSDTILDYV